MWFHQPKMSIIPKLSSGCYQLKKPVSDRLIVQVGISGFEPEQTEPKSVVLPLHHISIWLPFLILGLQRYECFAKMQNFFEKKLHFSPIL